jgi:hypothetical protein
MTSSLYLYISFINKIMRKKGGELLGQGGYACVFHPSIKCADDSKNGGISKNIQK